MKLRFSTIDILAIIRELQQLVGMRVNQVYDVDSKTYLLRLSRYEEKVILLLESGIRLHTTEYVWPKNSVPSGFSMKLRKHIKNKRLEKLCQLGVDRVIDLQFGINEASYHLILELYDKGNIIFTDHEYIILNILRPRTIDDEDVKFRVQERYPTELARHEDFSSLQILNIETALKSADTGQNLRKILLAHTVFGPALIDHIMSEFDFHKSVIGKDFNAAVDMPHVISCAQKAEHLMKDVATNNCGGYVIHKEKGNSENEILTNIEFHPFLFNQFKNNKYTYFESFNKAVDCYFSNMEGQKIDVKAFQKEKTVMKKLENIKQDHEQRLSNLHKSQLEDIAKAQLIEINLDLVDQAILIIRNAVANQISWSDIWDLIKEAQLKGDPVAKAIKKLKLDVNHFTLLLKDPFVENCDNSEACVFSQLVDIDLDYSAYANARKYYDLKRQHAKKEQKTLQSSEKALKNAEKKTKQTLKQVTVINSITKARKPMWFEKFIWFISSENYLVIAGRDIQQNEVIVKRYLKPGDIYVHADIHGASSVVIKNHIGGEVSSKTLNEAGCFAICYSSAWEAKITTSAWWVYHDQVSKTAPTGEYLTTGSFMIRGKKKYLPPSQLILGFGFIFKVDEDSIERHLGERQIASMNESAEEAIHIKSSIHSEETTEIHNSDLDEDSIERHLDERKIASMYESAEEAILVKSSTHSEETEIHNSDLDEDSIERHLDERKIASMNESAEEAIYIKSSTHLEETTEIHNSDLNDDSFERHLDERKIASKNKSTEAGAICIKGGTCSEETTKIHNSDCKSHAELDKCLKEFHFENAEEPKTDTINIFKTSFPDTKVKLDFKINNIDETTSKIVKQLDSNTKISELKKNESVDKNTEKEEKQVHYKRGQKSKSKKIKEKYKYQDEEERELRMKILASAGKPKRNKKKDLKCYSKSNISKPVVSNSFQTPNTKVTDIDNSVDRNARVSHVEDDCIKHEEVIENMEKINCEEMKLLNSLIGFPVPEDNILFAVPVCSPYMAVQNYKYKVKMIPGTERRGKAAKLALNIFLHDKLATTREKDCLKSVKDQDISRNFPNRVKISYINVKKHN